MNEYKQLFNRLHGLSQAFQITNDSRILKAMADKLNRYHDKGAITSKQAEEIREIFMLW